MWHWVDFSFLLTNTIGRSVAQEAQYDTVANFFFKLMQLDVDSRESGGESIGLKGMWACHQRIFKGMLGALSVLFFEFVSFVSWPLSLAFRSLSKQVLPHTGIASRSLLNVGFVCNSQPLTSYSKHFSLNFSHSCFQMRSGDSAGQTTTWASTVWAHLKLLEC